MSDSHAHAANRPGFPPTVLPQGFAEEALVAEVPADSVNEAVLDAKKTFIIGMVGTVIFVSTVFIFIL